MSLINFGSGNAKSELFSRIRPYPTPNIQGLVPNNAVPVVRSGNKNYFLIVSEGLSSPDFGRRIQLWTTNPLAMVAAIDLDSVTAGGRWLAMCLSSTDQCMYVVVRGTDTLIRLIKISDNTGAVTPIGAGVSPATAGNWQQVDGTLEDMGTGVLRYRCASKYHDINKTTGALILQDTSFSLPNYPLLDANYISLGGDIVSSLPYYFNTSLEGYNMLTPYTTHTSVGVIGQKIIKSEQFLGTYLFSTSTTFKHTAVMVDNDKMGFVSMLSGLQTPINITTRSDYDSFLQSLVDYAAGL